MEKKKLSYDPNDIASAFSLEELKIIMIGTLFRLAKIQMPKIAKVFYERPIAQNVNGYNLAVICDCLVATPLPFNKPTKPYFFFSKNLRKNAAKRMTPKGNF